MALFFSTPKPAALLDIYRQLIDEKHVDTWAYDPAGDFTHTPDQWRFKAWMKPYVLDNSLVFGIISRNSEPLSIATYGIYHGRLLESVTNHCDQFFSMGAATALIDPQFDVVDLKKQNRQLTQFERKAIAQIAAA